MATAVKSGIAAKGASSGKAAKKTAGAVKAKSAAASEKPAPQTKEKIRKPKLVRDSFTMPEAEYQVLRDLKKNCLAAGIDVKKSQLLRVGVAMLKTMDAAGLKERVDGLAPLKTGRPKKEK